MVTKQKSVIAFHGMVLYNNGRQQGKIWINCNKQQLLTDPQSVPSKIYRLTGPAGGQQVYYIL